MALALYRRYRPATFAEVVGQEHVTDPLRTALNAGRISHAYLFSGPRGCGKTSSARILARSLNCVRGPTADPCGTCSSCVALAPEGPGNVDVVELDAASHGGVDDARELRDRAFYAPAESRYRVFIIDEAHMVTTQGFNALLKIVEEPPDHLVFVFATTEPDKVLPTIRSRTHHYPFRLMPPAVVRDLLESICSAEGVAVEPPVFPLVVRAGGGSGRDTLSVMDQLLAGAGAEGVTYERAIALLGVTDVALIDSMVEALAAEDAPGVYAAVDQVIEAGHDPRRFATDLLERFRDLLLLRAVPDATDRGLVSAPEDGLATMTGQAERLGPAALTRFAEIVHSGLGEMRGSTSPRLLLELLCARMLLPAAESSGRALLQRVEAVEQRLAAGGGAVAAPVPGSAPTPSLPAAHEEGAPPRRAFQRPSQAPAQPPSTAERHEEAQRPEPPRTPEAAAPAPPEETRPAAPPPAPVAPAPARDTVDVATVRKMWPTLLSKVRDHSRSLGAMLTDAVAHSVADGEVVFTHPASALVRRLSDTRNSEIIATALREVLGGDWRVRCVSAEEAARLGQGGGASPATGHQPAPAPARHPEPPRRAPEPTPPRRTETARPAPRAVTAEDDIPLPPEPDEPEPPDPDPPAGAASPARGAAPRSNGHTPATDVAVPPGGTAVPGGPGAEGPEGPDDPRDVRPPRDPQETAIQLLSEQLGGRLVT
ncbi:DNA polymerase III subunit gamma and tau [Actinoalloteichus caeruleus]|uniref:DNA polymerase III subunit gamma and tau n=1 Tax=Actinoalloteichus cyanogriseus TaxID=2893586 RepID=UPI003BB9511F